MSKKRKKLNIVVITTNFPTISQTFVLNQITGLIDLGHNVDIFAFNNPREEKHHPDFEKYNLKEKTTYFSEISPQNRLKRVVKALQMFPYIFRKDPVIILKSVNFLKYGKIALSLELFYLMHYFMAKEYDIFQCHFGQIGQKCSYLKAIGIKTKLVTMFHGIDIRNGLKNGGSIYQNLFEYGDLFLSISQYNYENLITFGLNPEKIISHPVGIDLKKFNFKWDFEQKNSTNEIIILTVARLVEEKGYEYGLRAIKTLVSKLPEISLEYRIVGEGYKKCELVSLVNDLHLNNVVTFVGAMDHDEVVGEMQNADIFFLPSNDEALPVVLMEAQSVGLPVVATDVGSVFEVVDSDRSGFLVPQKNFLSMAEKLLYLCMNKKIWPLMGECGRKHVEEKYDINYLNYQLERIFKECLKNN